MRSSRYDVTQEARLFVLRPSTPQLSDNPRPQHLYHQRRGRTSSRNATRPTCPPDRTIRNKLQRQKGHIHASLRGVQKLCHGRNGGSKHCSIKRMNPFSSLPVSCPKFLSCTFGALAYHGVYSGCLEVQVCIDPVLTTDVPHCLVIFKRILFTKQRNQTICVCEPT